MKLLSRDGQFEVEVVNPGRPTLMTASASAKASTDAPRSENVRHEDVQQDTRSLCRRSREPAGYPALGDAVCPTWIGPSRSTGTQMISWPVLASRKIQLVHWLAGKLEPAAQLDQLYP